MMAPWVRRSWAPLGQTPLLSQRTRSHQKVSIIGALAVSPTRERVRCYFRLHPNQNIVAPLIVAFLRQLARRLKAPMVVVWDRLQSHHGKAVQAFLQDHSDVRTVLKSLRVTPAIEAAVADHAWPPGEIAALADRISN